MNNPHRARRSSWRLAGFVAAGVAAWFGSGALTAGPESPETESAAPVADTPMTVEVERLQAKTVTEEIRLQGHTAPNRQVTVRAETAGRIEAVIAERGERVKKGQVIARIALDDRKAQATKSEALVAQRERDYERIRQLADAGHLSGSRLDEANAQLQAARADLESIRADIDKTSLRAPFDGILNDRDVEVGEFVAVRDPLFTVVDDMPLVVSAALAQRDRAAVTVGQPGQVRLITGQKVEGSVRYLSAIADEQTRTFDIEIEIPNPSGSLPTGISAEAVIAANATEAHRLSPGWLVRTENDEFGVYLVNKESRATFAGVQIVRASTDAIWVTGLPTNAVIVSTGQGFLQDGLLVQVAERAAGHQPETVGGGSAGATP